MTLLSSIRRRGLDLLLDQPTLFGLVGGWTIDPARMRRPTRPGTKLVIDGYPRSANTFATVAFLHAQGHRGSFAGATIDVANHWHRPSQFLLAARWKIPAMALIRAPEPTIVSNMIYRGSDDVGYFLGRYVDFYEKVAKVRDRVMIVDFADVIADFGAVTRRLNARFATRFTPFDHTAENVAAVNAMILAHASRGGGHLGKDWQASQHLSLPVAGRESLKQRKEAALAAAAWADGLGRARRLYDSLRTG